MNEPIRVNQVRPGQLISWAEGCGMLVTHTAVSEHCDRYGVPMRKLSSGDTPDTGLAVHLPASNTVTVLPGAVSDHLKVVTQ